MRKVRDVLRYCHSAGLSLDATARALNISNGGSPNTFGWPLPLPLLV